MQLILREGGWESLVRLYLLLEANLIYGSIHLLHSNFPALVGRSPTSFHKVLPLEQIDQEKVKGLVCIRWTDLVTFPRQKYYRNSVIKRESTLRFLWEGYSQGT